MATAIDFRPTQPRLNHRERIAKALADRIYRVKTGPWENRNRDVRVIGYLGMGMAYITDGSRKWTEPMDNLTEQVAP
ncbi:MAG: hypothetical protein NUW01_11450 [Gemmatimonadaceae bacterium]|nr:hypothetical protein [Gemmatimonadaceae bacterium]